MQISRKYVRISSVVVAAAWFGICQACVSSPRSERAGSAVPTSASSGQAPAYAQPPPPAATKDEGSEAKPTEGRQLEMEPAATPVTRAKPSKADHAAPTSAVPARARGESASAPAMDKKKGASGGDSLLATPEDLRVDPLLPTLGDPPEIRSALQDFQGAADMLATSHGCDEGCRAFQSMQRAAARICSLVSSRDPTQRCATARTRVSDAQHDLKDRCGNCSN